MSDQLLQPGDRFGRYHIERQLGEGGFSTVYACRVDGSNAMAAVKVLRPKTDGTYDRNTMARFRREAESLSRLESPHVVNLIDYGEHDGLLFLATEHLEGQDLAAYLKRVPRVDEHVALHILRQLLAALEDAHRHGLLHRDIKPENIRIEQRGDDPFFVTLFDFGLARSTDDSHPAVTATGELVGTPRYMSPEQLRGASLTPASDIYSLGVVMLEMLVGRDALHGGSWGAQLDRLRTGHVLAAPMLEQISPRMRELIGAMTTTRENARLRTVAAVRSRLATGPNARPETRRDAKLWGILIASIIGIVGLGAVIISLLTPNPEPPATIGLEHERDNRAQSLLVTADVASHPPTDDAGATAVDRECGAPPFLGDGLFARDVPGYIPRSYVKGKAHPLVIMFHQWDESGPKMLEYTGFREMAERDQVVLVAPTTPDKLLTTWDPAIGPRIKEIVEASLCVDPERIYLVGQASGGEVVFSMLCEPWVAAIATNGYRLKVGQPICKSDKAKPYLMLAARHSAVSPFEGGPGECSYSTTSKVSVREQEKLWLAQAECGAPKRKLEKLSNDANECYEWDCDARFRSCHLDGDQKWPGSVPGQRYNILAPDCVGVSPDFPTSDVVWEFLMTEAGKR